MKTREEELAEGIRRWFEGLGGMSKDRRRRVWGRDVVGREIRRGLEGTGNWKNAARGCPRRGYEEMMRRRGVEGVCGEDGENGEKRGEQRGV
jgi:hypothetical protein